MPPAQLSDFYSYLTPQQIPEKRPASLFPAVSAALLFPPVKEAGIFADRSPLPESSKRVRLFLSENEAPCYSPLHLP